MDLHERAKAGQELMARPYSRVVVMHLTLILGAFLMAAFRDLRPGFVLLVALKVFVDLRAHLRENNKRSGSSGARGLESGGEENRSSDGDFGER
jgi:hypothetical protein